MRYLIEFPESPSDNIEFSGMVIMDMNSGVIHAVGQRRYIVEENVLKALNTAKIPYNVVKKVD
jgi:hypothetical protein